MKIKYMLDISVHEEEHHHYPVPVQKSMWFRIAYCCGASGINSPIMHEIDDKPNGRTLTYIEFLSEADATAFLLAWDGER